MELTISLRDQVLQRIIEWSTLNPDIKALALIGSGARIDHPADEWSDIDLILVTTKPDFYLKSSGWLNTIGELWIDTVEKK